MNSSSQDISRVTGETFSNLLKQHQSNLKSFLYRFTTSKEDAEDLAQETFAKAYQKLNSFKGESTFKTWLFAIAANLAKDHLRAKNRWPQNAQDKCRDLISTTPELQSDLKDIAYKSDTGKYEIKEHIDFCFTCVMKTLPLEQQLVLMLADIYSFRVKEIAQIMNLTDGVIKHHLLNSRGTMQDIFEHRCALINKEGICHQCSELNGFRNKKAETQRIISQMELVKAAEQKDKNHLFTLRTKLVKSINPLEANGTSLHDFLLNQTDRAVRENSSAPDSQHSDACCRAEG
jgi:RNA polymerase sigma-70 factor (ECF subfamily)